MTKNEFHKAIDICEKLYFFGGQRAGRELWFDKPVDVQDRDIQNFAEDVAFLKDYIKRQQAEIDRLIDLINEIGEYNEAWVKDNHDLRVELKTLKAEAIREFAERLKIDFGHGVLGMSSVAAIIDNLVKEMTEDES